MARTRPHPKRYIRKLESRKPCVHGEAGFELRPHQVVLRPLVTEKSTHAATRTSKPYKAKDGTERIRGNVYTFEVHMMADKNSITAAVQELFNVRVEAVRTQVRRAKAVRFKQKEGQQGAWKRALVTLHADDKIDFF